jgi:hypothetical protein
VNWAAWGGPRRLDTARAASITSASPAAFRKFWQSEPDRWSKLVHDIGAVAN